MKVLVVEASPGTENSIAACARQTAKAAPEVLVAVDDGAAMKAVDEHGTSIDLVIYDADRRGALTLSMLSRLRTSAELSHIPCVLVTANGSSPNARCALRHGAAGLVERPLKCDQLKAIIKRACTLGGRAASSAFKTESVTTMIRAISQIAGGKRRPASIVQRRRR